MSADDVGAVDAALRAAAEALLEVAFAEHGPLIECGNRGCRQRGLSGMHCRAEDCGAHEDCETYRRATTLSEALAAVPRPVTQPTGACVYCFESVGLFVLPKGYGEHWCTYPVGAPGSAVCPAREDAGHAIERDEDDNATPSQPAHGEALTVEVDRVARLLMAEWIRVEEKPVNVSYVATFADMARAVIADRLAAQPAHGDNEAALRVMESRWELFREHRPAGAYLPTGQLDGDCPKCGVAWPCKKIRTTLSTSAAPEGSS